MCKTLKVLCLYLVWLHPEKIDSPEWWNLKGARQGLNLLLPESKSDALPMSYMRVGSRLRGESWARVESNHVEGEEPSSSRALSTCQQTQRLRWSHEGDGTRTRILLIDNQALCH